MSTPLRPLPTDQHTSMRVSSSGEWPPSRSVKPSPRRERRRAPVEQGGEGARGRLGEREAHGVEDVAHRGHALVDVAGAEELLGGEAPQIERALRRGGRGGVQVGAPRLGAAPGVGERGGELDAQGLRLGRALDGPPVERGGAVEGQGLLGADGGGLGAGAGPAASPPASK